MPAHKVNVKPIKPLICASLGASLGIFLGESISTLQPLDLLGVQGPAAWPIVNPVFTAGGLKSYDGIAGPYMYLHTNPQNIPSHKTRLFMFHEATACSTGRRSIGIAESTDDGVTWRGLGTVLSSHADDSLQRPSLFEYKGQVFMVADSEKGPKLYRSTVFPLGWHYNTTLLQEPLRGVSIFKESGGLFGELWYMVGSLPRSETPDGRENAALKGGGTIKEEEEEDDLLAVYVSSNPFGPWKHLKNSPFKVSAASPGGSVTRLPGVGLVRLGCSCKGGLCGDVVARFMTLNGSTFVETPVQNFLGQRQWKQKQGWDGSEGIGKGKRNGASLLALPSGKIAALVVGQPDAFEEPWYPVWLRTGEIVFRGVALGCLALVSVTVAMKVPRWRLTRQGRHKGDAASSTAAAASRISPEVSGGMPPKSRAIQRLQAEERGDFVSSAASGRSSGLTIRRGGSASPQSVASLESPLAADLAARFNKTLATPTLDEKNATGSPLGLHEGAMSSLGNCSRGVRWRTCMNAPLRRLVYLLPELSKGQTRLLIAACIVFSGLAFGMNCVLGFFEPFWAPAPAQAAGGQFSRFTILVPSNEARRAVLDSFIRYYGECPSLGEIVILWPRDSPSPPKPILDFPWAAVPVRVRKQASTSLNNNYLPDDTLRFRGILLLEDTLRVPCADVEKAFFAWRVSPTAITGFSPHLAEASETPRYKAEPEAVAHGWYNLILSGAMFLDSRTAFPAYWAEDIKDGRAIVDVVKGCDDILVNFALAAAVKGKKSSTVAFVPPSRRVDVGWWFGVDPLRSGMSNYREDVEHCLLEFEKVIGRWPLRGEEFEWGGLSRSKKPWCWKWRRTITECAYI